MQENKPGTIFYSSTNFCSASQSDTGWCADGQITLEKGAAGGQIKIEGNPDALGDLLALLVNFDFWFNIVTP